MSEGAITGFERWADGRVWRLERDVDFRGSVRAFKRAARAAAADMGRAVRVVPDKLDPEGRVWLQFADGEVAPGEACPCCGSVDLRRLHEHWVRCAACRGMLLLSLPVDDDDVVELVEARPPPASLPEGLASSYDAAAPIEASSDDSALPEAPAATAPPLRVPKALDTLSGVELYRWRIVDQRELCYGHGLSPGGDVTLVTIEFKLRNGRRLANPNDSEQWLYTMRAMPYAPFEDIFDLESLRNDEPVSWKVALDPGPGRSAGERQTA